MVFYDHYNYQRYWQGRQYEHESEKIALKKFLKKIPEKNKKTILDIGAGFGRLAPIYANKFSTCYLIEPSKKLIKQGRERLNNYQNIFFQKNKIETLSLERPVEVVLIVRVLHHINDLSLAFNNVNQALKNNGYLILEFANKVNFKSQLKMWLRGDFLSCQDLSSCDRRSSANINKKTILFLNHHPKKIDQELEKIGFKIIDRLSVSNFRWPLLKKIIPTRILLLGEGLLQSILGKINFGPSIFILAKKIKN